MLNINNNYSVSNVSPNFKATVSPNLHRQLLREAEKLGPRKIGETYLNRLYNRLANIAEGVEIKSITKLRDKTALVNLTYNGVGRGIKLSLKGSKLDIVGRLCDKNNQGTSLLGEYAARYLGA